jgi:hypothetical protein
MSECVWTRCPQCHAEARFQCEDEEAAEAFRVRMGYLQDADGRFQIDQCPICGLGGMKRHEDTGGYFNHELDGVTQGWPQMGRPCGHCNLRIPLFLELDVETASRARELARKHNLADAMKTVHQATGCGLKWAQLWAEHPDGPVREPVPWPGPPCPHCGKPLRSKLAKQCFECGMDWHDPARIRKPRD